MSLLDEKPVNEKGANKILYAALGVAVLAVIAAVALLSLQPSPKQIEQDALEGAFREGTPEFQNYTKKIVAETEAETTTKSMTAMGTLTMSIGGKIRNFTGKTLTGLEVKVTVVDSFDKTVRERTMVIIPKQVEKLYNNDTMNVRVNIDGFDPKADLANIRWKVTAINIANPE